MMSQRAWRWPVGEEEEEEPCFLDKMARKPSQVKVSRPAAQHDPPACTISRRDEPSPPPPPVQAKRSAFLHLPAELRIRIYEEVAKSTHMVHEDRASLSPRAVRGPGLLLACRQTDREFLPILCALAKWTIFIHEFDFKPAIITERHISGLLRENSTCGAAMLLLNTKLELVLINSLQWDTSVSAFRIWQWIQHNFSCETPLTWVYRVEQSRQDQLGHEDHLWYKWKVGISELWALRDDETREEAIAVLEKLLWAFEDEAKRVQYAVGMRDITGGL